MTQISVALPNKFYDFPEVSTIFENREPVDVSVLTEIQEEKQQELVCFVKTGNMRIPVYSNPVEDMCKMLYDHAIDSKVGKGSETVLDKEVRSSREFSSGITWDEKFLATVKNNVEEALERMNAGTLSYIQPHKLVIYGAGDFFAEHMDSTHTPGQNMTCVVELISLWWNKNQEGLEINGKNYYPEDDDMTLYVFDHDLPHQVHKVGGGYRISVTFDLVVDPIDEKRSFENTVEKMKALGVRKFGFFATQRYLEDQALKGSDARVVDAFSPFATYKRENLYTSDCRDWYLEDVWSVMNMGIECGSLMCEVEELSDDEEEPCHGEDYREPSVPKKVTPPESWEPKKDDGTLSRVIKDEFHLGDVFPLWSPHEPRHTMRGDEEINLGNEGFFGDIHENLFVIMTLE